MWWTGIMIMIPQALEIRTFNIPCTHGLLWVFRYFDPKPYLSYQCSKCAYEDWIVHVRYALSFKKYHESNMLLWAYYVQNQTRTEIEKNRQSANRRI